MLTQRHVHVHESVKYVPVPVLHVKTRVAACRLAALPRPRSPIAMLKPMSIMLLAAMAFWHSSSV